jgi:hypothetical protein
MQIVRLCHRGIYGDGGLYLPLRIVKMIELG